MPALTLEPWGRDLRVIIDDAQIGTLTYNLQRATFSASKAVIALTGCHEAQEFASPADWRHFIENALERAECSCGCQDEPFVTRTITAIEEGEF